MDNEIMSLDEILADPYYLNQFNEKLKLMTDGSLKAEKDDSLKMEDKKMDKNIQPSVSGKTGTGNTQPQAENVDIQAILKQAEEKANEIADRKAQAVFEDMIKQQNPNLDKETIRNMIKNHKSKQVTPEKAEIEELKEKLNSETEKIAELTQREIVLTKGVPLNTEDEDEKEKVTACLTLAKSYVNESTTFEVALDKALKIISFEDTHTLQNFYSGGGATQVNKINKEDYKTYEQKLELKAKNPKLFATLFPKKK